MRLRGAAWQGGWELGAVADDSSSSKKKKRRMAKGEEGVRASAALPPLLIGNAEMIVQPHTICLNKKKPKGGNILGRKEEARIGLGTNCRVPPRMSMDDHRKFS